MKPSWFLYNDDDNHFFISDTEDPSSGVGAGNALSQVLTDWIHNNSTATIYGAEGSGKEELLTYYFNEATCKALAENHIYAIFLSGAEMGRYQTSDALLAEIHARACACAKKYGVELTEAEKAALLTPGASDQAEEKAHRVLWLLPQINRFISRNFTESKKEAAIALLQETVTDQTPLQIIATNNYLYPDLVVDPDKPPSSYVFNNLKDNHYTLPLHMPSKAQFAARIKETLPSIAEEDIEWFRLMTRGLSQLTACLLDCYQKKQQLSPEEREGKTVRELALQLFLTNHANILKDKWLRFLDQKDKETLVQLAWDTAEQSFSKKDGFAYLNTPLSTAALPMGLVEQNGAMTKYRFTCGLLRAYLRQKYPLPEPPAAEEPDDGNKQPDDGIDVPL